MQTHSTELQFDEYAEVLAISPNSDCTILTGSPLKVVDLESTTMRTLCPDLGFSSETSAAAFSVDGQRILASVNETLVVLDADTLAESHRFSFPGYWPSIVRLDCEQIALASGWSVDSEGYVFFGSIEDGQFEKREFLEMVNTIEFNGSSLFGTTYEFEDGQFVDGKRIFRIRDFVADTCRLRLDLRDASGGGYPLASPQHDRLLLGHSGYKSSIEMIDLERKQSLFVLDPPDDSTPILAFSPDGRQFAWAERGGVSRSREYRLSVHNSQTGKLVHDLGNLGTPHEVVYSPTGTMLCAAGHDRGAWIWDSRTGERIAQIPEQSWPVFFSADEQWLISASAITRIGE